MNKGNLSAWNELLDSQKSKLSDSMTELEISALYSCLEDSYEGFTKIYGGLLGTIHASLRNGDYDALQTRVLEIYWEFDHIRRHINDAEKAFLALSKQLENQDEQKAC